VHGQGLLLGVEFAPLSAPLLQHFRATDVYASLNWFIPKLNDTLNAFHAYYAMHCLLQTYAIYAQTARSHPLVLRVQPPLTITRAQVERFLEAMAAVCGEMTAFTDLMEAVVTKSIREVEIGALRPKATAEQPA